MKNTGASTAPRMPDVCVAGRWSSGEELSASAVFWSLLVDERLGETRVCVAALPASPEGVVLMGALSARRAAFAALSPEPDAWPRAPLLGPGVPLVLPPSLACLRDEAERHGFAPLVLPAPVQGRPLPERPLLASEGVVVMTSGSTGVPKAVFRPMSRLVAGVVARNRALGLGAGDGLVGGVPLFSGQGVGQVVTAMVLGGALGILPPRDHREALAMLEHPAFTLWRATPHFADVLGRCELARSPRVPPLCVLSSPIAGRVFDTFLARFGVPLRQGYSSTETGVVSVDGGPASTVVAGSVGFPVDGVEICIGDTPDDAGPPGAVGRVWVKSPWIMGGYGAPPDLHAVPVVGAWWPTRDCGTVDVDGRLRLAGRIDDSVRTRDGRLVDLAKVANLLASLPGVSAAIALPMESDIGVSVGAVLECAGDVTFESLRPAIAAALPAAVRPRQTVIVPELPRLSTGKPDRLACLALLGTSAAAERDAAARA